MSDLARQEGSVVLHERPVRPNEVGKPLSAIFPGLGLRVYRQGQPHGFAEPACAALEPGDTIIEVLPNG